MHPRDFSDELRQHLRGGATLDAALRVLRANGASVIECIVAVRWVRGCDLEEAKRVVHASPVWADVAAQNEKLYEELEAAAREIDPMMPSLYTVTVDFEDRTFAVEQVTVLSPEEALEHTFRQAEALEKYPSDALESMRREFVRINEVANARGVWIWHQVPNDADVTADIFGGLIIRTDSGAPTRSEASVVSGANT